MKKGVGAQPDLFQAPAPAITLPEFLSGKAVELLQTLLIEAVSPGLAEREEKHGQEGSDDHDHA
jgi:hypothetical protein